MNKFSILYEDKEIFLVNKPCGTAVQGGKGVAHPFDEEFSKQVGFQIHLVHRLDKETSGILIVAKDSKAAAKWTKLIQTDSVQKEYIAVITGKPEVNGRQKDKGILKSSVEVHGRLLNAETYFTVEKNCNVQLPANENSDAPEAVNLSIVRLTLGTGRMHQLRIQLSKANSPIAGDDLHGNFKTNKLLRKLGIKKLQLAAVKLTIPLNGKSCVFEIPLPEHMQKAVNLF